MMIKKIAALTLLFMLGRMGHAQVTLFSENFETGGSSFTLNTTDVSSVTDATGYNKWIINNAYAGGSGSLICLSFPIGYSIASTAAQPSGITGFPNSNYMHILSDEAQTDGILCSSYLAADGFCNFAQAHFSGMNSDFSTVGYSGTTLSFYWLCGGSANGYGQVYYSTNSGSSWTLVTVPISNYSGAIANWVQQTITLPAFDNQPTLRFGFRFVNNQTTAAADPGFCVDQVLVTGTFVPTITTGTVSPTSFCPGDAVSVPFTVSGTYNIGNQFDAELSDAMGSFASPTVIGSLVGTSAGTINGTIPMGAAAGTGYRIRVVSSLPAITGTANSVNLTINPLPDAGVASAADTSLCSGDSAVITLTGSSGTLNWQISTNGVLYSSTGQTSASFNTGQISSNVWYRAIVTNPCGADTSNIVAITVSQPPVGGLLTAVPDSICAGDSSLLTLTGASGTADWQISGDGISYNSLGFSGSMLGTGPLSNSMYYQVVSSSPDCPDDNSNFVQVTVLQIPVAAFTYTLAGLDVTFSNTSMFSTSWDWDFGDGATSTDMSPVHTYAPGNYLVTLIASNELGCSDTLTDSVTLMVGMQEAGTGGFSAYPNPFHDEVRIFMEGMDAGEVEMTLLDPTGRELQASAPGKADGAGFSYVFRTADSLAPGMYWLRVKTRNGEGWLKLIKN